MTIKIPANDIFEVKRKKKFQTKVVKLEKIRLSYSIYCFSAKTQTNPNKVKTWKQTQNS